MFKFHRIQVIDRFQVTKPFALDAFLELPFHAVNHTFCSYDFFDNCVGPIHAGDIGGVIESQAGAVPQIVCDCQRVLFIHEQRMLAGGAPVLNEGHLRPGHRGFDLGFDLIERKLHFVGPLSFLRPAGDGRMPHGGILRRHQIVLAELWDGKFAGCFRH